MARTKETQGAVNEPRSRDLEPRSQSALLGTALLSNSLILVVGAWAWAHSELDPQQYKALLQEDGPAEWATVVAFLAAALLAAGLAWKQRRQGRPTWYLIGVALFCFLVAGEEASWGQRLVGYQPPEYFLANNFQQEFNVHNVLDTSLRKLVLKGIILGYGVLLPLLGVVTGVRRRLREWGVETAPVYLAPSFLAIFWLYNSYPLELTGEVVELMLGLAFLLGLFEIARRIGPRRRSLRLRTALAGSWAATLLLGFAAPAVTLALLGEDAAKSRDASLEVAALRDDFRGLSGRPGRQATKCGLHKRVFSYVESYEQSALLERDFAALEHESLASERARYFLDPWNNPYWIRHKCNKKRQLVRVFVYSFGPNRKRDSTDWELRSDDIGAMIAVIGRRAEGR